MNKAASLAASVALTLLVLRILSPCLVLLATASLVLTRPPQPPSSPSPITPVVIASYIPRRALILTLLSLTSLTYLLDGLVFVVFAIIAKSWSPSAIDTSSVLGIIAYSGLATFGSWKEVQGVQVWSRKRVKLAIAASLALEFTIVIIIGSRIGYPLHIPENPSRALVFTLINFSLTTARVLILLILLPSLVFPRVVYTAVPLDDAVESPIPIASSLLLPQQHPTASTGLSPFGDGAQSKYGTFTGGERGRLGVSNGPSRSATPTPSTHGAIPKTNEKPEIALDPSWRELFRRIRRITPYLWPSKSRPLQLLAGLCVILLILGRVVNAALPIVFGRLIEFLETKKGNPWPTLGLYVALWFLQSSGGLSALRETFWAPVMQYSDREMSQLSFNHILNLSFAWHSRRRTGEVLRTLDRGSAINRIFELILFEIIPIFLDIIIALAVFVAYFEWSLALIIAIIITAYVSTSIALTKLRTFYRRRMNDCDVACRGIHTDCLLNYETVKYFGGENHEGARFSDAIRDYQAWEYKYLMSSNLLHLAQTFLITLGLLVGCLIVAHLVVTGHSKPSHFVIFVTYLTQLYRPLVQLGTIYRTMNQRLIDTERLLVLLSEPTEVNDEPDAPDLVVKDGEIEFDNVSFSYDGRSNALSSISFKVPKGSSVALVGESGAGKSTILRLLYRFYDLNQGEGRILIDGQNIREVTQSSLRRAIGVVPQDPVLFNSSIEYNIGYGKFGASSQEIELAAQAAQMHDRIQSFPDGYNTKVGERGVRLSGGEKQRVAIARTLLKNPPILLLDEATSALDTSTEKDIQKALQHLVQGRSSLSIAHRLSTIASADLILVLKDGHIIEQGTHKELVARDGVFASMWAEQITASEDPAIVLTGERSSKQDAAGYPVHGDGVTEPAHSGEPSATTEGPVDVPETIFERRVREMSSAQATSPSTNEESTSATSGPIAFPVGDNASQKAPSIAAASPPLSTPTQTPAVTFGSEVNTPPRSQTPDPESETKRKRTPGQNLQRLARRISLTTRKEGSAASLPRIPGFGRKESSKDESRSLRGETSAGGANVADSPADSLSGDGDTDKKKAKAKAKRKSLG